MYKHVHTKVLHNNYNILHTPHNASSSAALLEVDEHERMPMQVNNLRDLQQARIVVADASY